MRYSINFPNKSLGALDLNLNDEVTVLQRLSLLEFFGPEDVLANRTNEKGEFEVPINTSFGKIVFTVDLINGKELIIRDWRKFSE